MGKSLEHMQKSPGIMNFTPFVRQHGILSNEWGDLLCREGSQIKTVVDEKGDYLLSVKGSQEALETDIAAYVLVPVLQQSMHWLLDVHFEEDFCRVEDKASTKS